MLKVVYAVTGLLPMAYRLSPKIFSDSLFLAYGVRRRAYGGRRPCQR